MAVRSQANGVPDGPPAPGYLFFGEETYLADIFLRDLQARIVPPDVPDFHPDVFYLDETGWDEILDASRTMTLFFSPWRIIIVRLPAKNEDPDRKDNEPGLISDTEAKLIKEYFKDPPARTVMAVIFPGRVRKSGPVARLFAGLPGVVVREVKPVKEWEAGPWLAAKARSLGKGLAPEAVKRLQEIVGLDLRRLDNEIDKLAVYVGDKKTIDLGDVNQATAWARDYDPFELGNALESGDLRECLLVLDGYFKAEEKSETILYRFISFFRDVLKGRVMLEEDGADKKAIFRKIKPQISESYGDFYWKKYAAFFGIVEGLSQSEVVGLLESLAGVDAAVKSTGIPPKAAFGSFLYEYCRLRKKLKPTSRAWT